MKQLASLILALLCTNLMLQSQDQKGDNIVKVLSFNILHGRTTQGDFNLDVLANLILEADPDLVAMQEVDFKANRSKKYDLATELGWRTKMAPLFGRAMPFDGGEYGEAVLARSSFLATRNVGLPHLPGQEPRAALEIITLLPSGDTIAFVGTHLAHEGEAGRIMQAEAINAAFAGNPHPTILAGDLNARPGSQAMQILESVWTASDDQNPPAGTYPSHDPRVKIDYVLFHPRHRWRVLDRQVIADTIASDHCAYLVTLELLGQ